MRDESVSLLAWWLCVSQGKHISVIFVCPCVCRSGHKICLDLDREIWGFVHSRELNIPLKSFAFSWYIHSLESTNPHISLFRGIFILSSVKILIFHNKVEINYYKITSISNLVSNTGLMKFTLLFVISPSSDQRLDLCQPRKSLANSLHYTYYRLFLSTLRGFWWRRTPSCCREAFWLCWRSICRRSRTRLSEEKQEH